MIEIRKIDQFIQSPAWSLFQESGGFKVVRAEGYFLLSKPLWGKTTYLYAPKVVADNLDFGKLAQANQPAFIRFEPVEPSQILNDSRVIKTIDVQPAQTLILDLSLGLEKLLAGMHQKTRYNIRLAEKKGVRIFSDNSRIEAFINLLKVTTDRDQFKGHSDNYYRQLAKFNPEFIKLFLAEYQGKIIAAGLFAFSGNCATYLHGASSNQERQVMAPYLLQWEVIKAAQATGYKYYDFYGISDQKWPGVTRFKKGFGGEVVGYPGTFDYIVKPGVYRLYKLLRTLRRLI
jgi:lipid II:glycine glycyltransferase (peptidoglycan interpeptide bridge formation enzyme)